MKQEIQDLREKALRELAQVSDASGLSDWKVRYLGKKSEVTALLRGMGQLTPEERPVVGSLVNELRQELEDAFSSRERQEKEAARNLRLANESIDITLPGRTPSLGTLHPLAAVIEEIENIFIGLGFSVAEGPEVELDVYNFEMLNVPKDHPARDMQDTFYITEEVLLRTHTSPMQARTMLARQGEVPLRIICPGRVYRRDDDDATHSHMFAQIEGLVVDRDIRMSDLKGTLYSFAKQMFGDEQKVRLRPSFFPFTEPSAEVDLVCVACHGAGCRICKQTGWIEILGSGMVHPLVLEMAGYNPREYTGFAFGMGVERIAMLKYGIDNIRNFFVNDVRFLSQFKVGL